MILFLVFRGFRVLHYILLTVLNATSLDTTGQMITTAKEIGKSYEELLNVLKIQSFPKVMVVTNGNLR